MQHNLKSTKADTPFQRMCIQIHVRWFWSHFVQSNSPKGKHIFNKFIQFEIFPTFDYKMDKNEMRCSRPISYLSHSNALRSIQIHVVSPDDQYIGLSNVNSQHSDSKFISRTIVFMVIQIHSCATWFNLVIIQINLSAFDLYFFFYFLLHVLHFEIRAFNLIKGFCGASLGIKFHFLKFDLLLRAFNLIDSVRLWIVFV